VFNPHLQAKYNFGQGFDIYDDNKTYTYERGFGGSGPKHERYETAKRIFNKAGGYLKKNKARPVFLYLHYRDVHSPYIPPPPYDKLFFPSDGKPKGHMRVARYDGEIRYTDEWIKKTMEMFKEHNINRRNSIIIITADHGEAFRVLDDHHPEDSRPNTHGRTLYRELIHVPLILSIPGIEIKKKVIDAYVELNDIVPTTLDALGIPWQDYDQFQGKSLIPLMKGMDNSPRVAISGGSHGRGAIIEGGYKYYLYEKNVHDAKKIKYNRRPSDAYTSSFGEQLFDITKDPLETRNLINQEKAIASYLREKLHALKESVPARKLSSPVELDEVTVEQLKSLGYLQ